MSLKNYKKDFRQFLSYKCLFSLLFFDSLCAADEISTASTWFLKTVSALCLSSKIKIIPLLPSENKNKKCTYDKLQDINYVFSLNILFSFVVPLMFGTQASVCLMNKAEIYEQEEENVMLHYIFLSWLIWLIFYYEINQNCSNKVLNLLNC